MVLAVSVLISIVLITIGFNIRKLTSIRFSIKSVNPDNVFHPDKLTVIINVSNTSMFQFNIESCNLNVTAGNKTIAKVAGTYDIKVKPLRTTELPLHIDTDLSTKDIGTILTTGIVIEGRVWVIALGKRKIIQVKESYALSSLFQAN